MKTAFLADVHGNLEAFTAVCGSLRQLQVDAVVFIGDIVGYGANPNECIEGLRELTAQVVMGNHDSAAAGCRTSNDFNPIARTAIEWTKTQLTADSRQFLSQLPLSLEYNGIMAVHATPLDPDKWRYIFSPLDAEDAFAAFTQPLCFMAHTHSPVVYIETAENGVARELCGRIHFQSPCRYLVNSGSVGQPRDGDARACYGIYNDETRIFNLVRVAYDIPAAQRKILDAGLPPFLAERLSQGR